VSWFEVGINLTLIKGFLEPYKFSGIAQGWSLTVEECFYLTAPWLFVVLRRWGPIWLTAFLVSAGLFLWLVAGGLHWHGLFGSVPFVLFYTFFGRSFDFIVGMWLAWQWHSGRLTGVRYTTICGLVLIAVCVGWQTWITGQAGSSTTLVWSEFITYNLGLPVGIGFFVHGLLCEPSRLKRVLAQPIALALGRSSYAFYLIHIGVISKLIQQKLTGTNPGFLFMCLIALAYGLYRWVEKPLQQRFRAE
jgi:peptidoglycan/LPS O-acetylase OafA/YrhL